MDDNFSCFFVFEDETFCDMNVEPVHKEGSWPDKKYGKIYSGGLCFNFKIGTMNGCISGKDALRLARTIMNSVEKSREK